MRLASARVIAAAASKAAAHESPAILLQAWVRGVQSRTRFSAAFRAVRVIQSFWRRVVGLIRFRRMRASVIKTQKWLKAVKRREMEQVALAKAIEEGTHVLEEAIVSEMERNGRDQVDLLLLKPHRVRRTSACVRRLAKRVESLPREYKEKSTPVKSSEPVLPTGYERDRDISSPTKETSPLRPTISAMSTLEAIDEASLCPSPIDTDGWDFGEDF